MQLSTNHTFNLPNNPQLKVGTIDQLMQLSDDLAKIDTFVEVARSSPRVSCTATIHHSPFPCLLFPSSLRVL
jgi:hypothetical protein